MKIWYQSTLNMARHPGYERALHAHFERIVSPGTEVVLRGRESSFGSDLEVGDVTGSPIMYHEVVVPEFVASVLAAERAGADAFIIGSFSEPVLPELRSLAQIPVVSMPEACFVAASLCAPRVGLVTLNKIVVPFVQKSAKLHGWSGRLSGIHQIDGHLSEEELDANIDTPGRYLDGLIDGVRIAIAAGAQIVIPAEGVLAVMAAQNGLREVDGVPVVDAIATPVLTAEFMVALKQRTGVAQSRAAYPLPSDAARQLLSQR